MIVPIANLEPHEKSYTLKNWTALNRYCDDGDLEIDNNATERSIRGVAVGRRNCKLVPVGIIGIFRICVLTTTESSVWKNQN